jgi:hypothetical protein
MANKSNSKKSPKPTTLNPVIPADLLAKLPNPTTVEGDPIVHALLCHESGVEFYVIGKDYEQRGKEPHIYAFSNWDGQWRWFPLSKLETGIKLQRVTDWVPTPASELGILS